MSKAREIAELGAVYDSGALSNRNFIINGAMQVAQRGTSFTSVSSNAYHLDRHQSYNSTTGTGVATITQSSDAPDGFGNSYKLEVTTADSSLASTAEYGLYHYLEGQNLQSLKKGTSAAESLTVSFWVKANFTGTFVVELMDNDNSNRHINKSYTIDSANTWEYKTITFAGDTTGTLDDDNGNSFHLNFWLGGGSSYTSGTLQTSWGSLDQTGRAAGQTNVYGTLGNTWQVTGVQMELGESATPFEHRSYGDELLRCQRYYYKSDTYSVSMANATTTSYDYRDDRSAKHSLPVRMRSLPSVSLVQQAASYSGTMGIRAGRDFVYASPASHVTMPSGEYWYGGYTADAEL